MGFVKLTPEQLTQLKVDDVVYIRGFVNEPDTPGFPGLPSVYFGEWEEINNERKTFIPENQAVINPNSTKGATLFVKSDLLGKTTLITPKDNAFKRGKEVFISVVVTKIHKKEESDEWDYWRAITKRGVSKDDMTTQTFMLTEGNYEVYGFIDN